MAKESMMESMIDTCRRALQLIAPTTGLPRAVVNQPTPQELVDEHFVYKSNSMDYADDLVIGKQQYAFDLDVDGDEE
jgi:hypothetical protein